MPNLTRIEEATKQIREALWMAYCSGRAKNKYIPEEVLPDLLKRCQLFPQPLDDEKLREKITTKINEALKSAGLHLCWITEGESPEPISYGLADEYGDEIDIALLREEQK